MSNRWIKVVPLALALPLIIAGCSNGSSGPQLDQRSYQAGYLSAGPMLVEQGLAATSACQQAIQAASLFQAADWEPYDQPSFNSGCYAAIRAHGFSVKNDTGGPVNAN
jgi:hypothetical protein